MLILTKRMWLAFKMSCRKFEQLSTLIKIIETMGQMFVNAPLKSLLYIYEGAYF